LIKKWPEIADEVRNKYLYLFLDFDGTLTLIRRHPKKVRLSGATAKALKKLLSRENISVAVISGRALRDVRRRVGVSGIVYAGNHGLEARGPGLRHVVPEALKAKRTISKIGRELKKRYRSFRGIYIEDKTLTLSVHFRMVDKRRVKQAENIFKSIAGPYSARGRVVITKGKKVWEIRPPVKWDKGKTALHLLGEKQKQIKGRIVPFYIGDDRTDEDAFRLLKRRGYTIKVGKGGGRSSFADYYLSDTGEVRRFLGLLFTLKRGLEGHV